jgi:hypothetical protein
MIHCHESGGVRGAQQHFIENDSQDEAALLGSTPGTRMLQWQGLLF